MHRSAACVVTGLLSFLTATGATAACAVNAKLGDSLCSEWVSLSDTAVLRVRFFLPWPPIVCNDDRNTGTDTCSAFVLDSTRKYWLALKPDICRGVSLREEAPTRCFQ